MRFLATMLFLIPLCAQTPPPQDAPKQPGRGGGPPKNLKVLPADTNIRVVMGSFRAALGVDCEYCHVRDRASDENPKKDIARMMITMVHDINARFPDAKEHVTCYTCHRGKTEPATAPEAAAPPPAPKG